MNRMVTAALLAATLALCGCSEAARETEKPRQPQIHAGQSAVKEFWRTYRGANQLRLAGDLEGAAREYRTALGFDPDHQDALYYLGNVQLELHRFQDALDAWRRLRAVEPQSARAHRRIGDVFTCLEHPALVQLDSAHASYRRAFEINKEETGSQIRLGEVALLQGRFDDSERHFAAVSRANETSVEALLLSGYVRQESGSLDEALRLYAAARSHAQPPAAPHNFSGEGDTRSGAAMIDGSFTCRPFQRIANDLHADPDAAATFSRLRVLIEGARASSD